jgi:serine/threonine-protein kinase
MTTLGKYELHEQLGRGGFGTVYRATDTVLGREVAIKVLHPQLTTDPDFLERFRNEARLVASLDSPNIVTIYDLGEIDGRVFIAMKYLPGGSLKEKLEKEGAVCAGLAVAHKKGLVHRDIKPGNILFDSEGRAVLGDFGLARAIQLSSASAASSTGGVGTPAYRAPELWLGKPPASPATDIYSLCCVLSEMLTGEALFDGDTTEEVLTKHLIIGPNLPAAYPFGVPKGILAVVEKAVSKDPQERYQTVKEFEKGLTELSTIRVNKQPEPEQPETRAKRYQEPAQTKEENKIPPPEPATDNFKQNQSLTNLWLGVAGVIIVGLVIALIITTKKDPSTMAVLEVPTNTGIPIATQVQQIKATNTPARTSPTLTIGSSQVSTIDGMKLMYVPAGNFLMGSPDGVGNDNEHPQHTVYLDAYWIDQTEVTNGMYEKCVAAGGCTELSNKSSYTHDSYYGNSTYNDYPVINVDWDQANNYCAWAGRTLPTEAQWEKAARGMDGRTYPWGEQTPDQNLVNYNQNVGDTTAVGSYPGGASPYGALDMAGNVWEWVADWYSADYYQSSPSDNPTGPDSGEYRSLRGGSWFVDEFNVRAANRDWSYPSLTDYSVGFRCSLSQ